MMDRKMGVVKENPGGIYSTAYLYVTDFNSRKTCHINDILGVDGRDKNRLYWLLNGRRVSYEIGLDDRGNEGATKVQLEEKPSIFEPLLLKVSFLLFVWEYLGYLSYPIMLKLIGILGVALVFGLSVPVYIFIIYSSVNDYLFLKRMYNLQHQNVSPPA